MFQFEWFRKWFRNQTHAFIGSEEPVHMFNDTVLYTPTICGGDNKTRDEWIQMEASRISRIDMQHHPCGCEVCHANVLLFNVRKLRMENNADPVTGETLPPAAATKTKLGT